ncbi:MAG: magnesium transporter [Ruminococcaceae bacterium]|nr:magnesium transporter [Oscillospiraceae bacterium]
MFEEIYEDLCKEIEALIEEKKYSRIRAILQDMEPADIALLFEEFPDDETTLMFRLLPKELAAECFVEMDTDVQKVLVEAFSDAELGYVVDKLFVDDTVDIIEEMPANIVKRILKQASPEKRNMINQLLHYPKDSAGSIMTTEFVHLRARMTVGEAFAKIREIGEKKEIIYTCYVTDSERHLKGVITVKEMILAGEDAVLDDIMETAIVSVNTHDDKEDVARSMDKYNFLALPVVDNEERLVGIVTFDDAMDVISEEDTEDIQSMAAILPSDKPYLKTGTFETWRKRIPWLLLLMLSATLTSQIIAGFETKLAAASVLIAYIPMLMGTGGNCGSQSSVTVIRGLSLDEIEFSDFFRVIWREIRVSVLCGATLAAVNFVKIIFVDGMLFGNDEITLQVNLIISLSIVVTVFIAKLVGAMLPMLAQKIGFDPAVMASPFITTIVDALSLVIYFQFAKLILHL